MILGCFRDGGLRAHVDVATTKKSILDFFFLTDRHETFREPRKCCINALFDIFEFLDLARVPTMTPICLK